MTAVEGMCSSRIEGATTAVMGRCMNNKQGRRSKILRFCRMTPLTVVQTPWQQQQVASSSQAERRQGCYCCCGIAGASTERPHFAESTQQGHYSSSS